MKKIRGYKKSDMLYPDRGMIKWAPMLLSDHSEDMQRRLEQKKEDDSTNTYRESEKKSE